MDEPKINERYKRVATYYCGECIGNAEQACIKAGYSERHARGNAHKIVRRPEVQQYIVYLMQEARRQDIMNIQQIQAFWSDVVKDPEESMKNRLKASELLAKAQGMFNTEW